MDNVIAYVIYVVDHLFGWLDSVTSASIGVPVVAIALGMIALSAVIRYVISPILSGSDKARRRNN